MAGSELVKMAPRGMFFFLVVCVALTAGLKNLCESVTGGKGACEEAPGCSSPLKSPLGPYFRLCKSGFDCCVQEPDPEPTEAPATCGQKRESANRRLLNGDEVSPCEWPFTVSIRTRYNITASGDLDLNTTQSMCGGVLVGDKWVLTHPLCCFSAGGIDNVTHNLLVVTGEYDVTKNDTDPESGDPAETVISVSRCLIHPGFNVPDSLEDFDFTDFAMINGNATALIELAEPLQSPCASEACLPSVAATRDQQGPMEECVIMGWGFTDLQSFQLSDTLKKGEVRIYNDSVCDYLTRAVSPFLPRPDGTICQVPSSETDVCLGDHGGPVLCNHGDQWTVQGILPFNMCLEGQSPNPFIIDISRFEDWITETMAMGEK